MRSLILAVFSAALLSVSCSAFAQGAQPIPQPTIPSPTPRAVPYQPSSSEYHVSYAEPGRYHPCPASVGFNSRTVCLGLERGPRTYGCGRWCRW